MYLKNLTWMSILLIKLMKGSIWQLQETIFLWLQPLIKIYIVNKFIITIFASLSLVLIMMHVIENEKI